MTSKALSLCDNCRSHKEITSNGFIICTECGIAKRREYVDHLPIKKTRYGDYVSQNSQGNTLDNPNNLGSYIGRISSSSFSDKNRRMELHRIRKYRRLSIFYQEPAKRENNATHLRTILAFKKISNELNLPHSIQQRCLYIYWKQVKKEEAGEISVTNHILLITLCLLYAVREAGSSTPIRFSEIINAFAKRGHRVTNKNIIRLSRELDFELTPKRRKPEDYINRIAGQVREDRAIQERLQFHLLTPEGYEMKLIHISQYFLKLLGRRERGGVQPFPFAVSIVYLADRCLAKSLRKRPVLTQKLLADAVDSAEFTIRDHIYRFLGDLYTKYEEKLIEFTNSHLNFEN